MKSENPDLSILVLFLLTHRTHWRFHSTKITLFTYHFATKIRATHLLIKYLRLLCARNYIRYWGYVNEQNCWGQQLNTNLELLLRLIRAWHRALPWGNVCARANVEVKVKKSVNRCYRELKKTSNGPESYEREGQHMKKGFYSILRAQEIHVFILSDLYSQRITVFGV